MVTPGGIPILLTEDLLSDFQRLFRIGYRFFIPALLTKLNGLLV